MALPDLAGMTEADALDALARSDLAGGTLEYRESAAEAGLVLEQWPAAGQPVEIGSAVDLVIAAVETVEIPNLVGLPIDGARQVLGALRLVVGSETRQPSRADAEGTVIAQDPPVAARLAVGSPVDLVVAEPALIRVPEIVGLAIDDVDARADRRRPRGRPGGAALLAGGGRRGSRAGAGRGGGRPRRDDGHDARGSQPRDLGRPARRGAAGDGAARRRAARRRRRAHRAAPPAPPSPSRTPTALAELPPEEPAAATALRSRRSRPSRAYRQAWRR